MRGRAWGALLALLSLPLAAQPVTEGEAHVASAFISGADPGVFAAGLRLGPALRRQLGEADAAKVYAALAERTAGRPFEVRVLQPAEAARHATLVGSISDPLLQLEAGELRLLLQYSPAGRHVTFVEQLSGPAPRSEAPPPRPLAVPLAVPAPRPATPAAPAVLAKPKPAPAKALPPKPVPPAAQAPKIRADCVIKPVMSDEELRACGAR